VIDYAAALEPHGKQMTTSRAPTVIYIGDTFSQEFSFNTIEGGFFERDRYVAVRR
jgi:hypothetical protein